MSKRIPVSQRAAVPARTLADVPKLCDPYTPLEPGTDDALRQDLSAIRGGDRLARIVRNIRRSGGTPTLHFLSGHLGSGKTTELLAVRRRLERGDGEAAPLHVLFVDAEALLDPRDVDLEDILVAIWRVIWEQDKAAATEALTEVWKDRIKRIAGEMPFKLPDVLGDALLAVLKFLRQAPSDEKHRLRVTLSSVASALVEGLNAAFDALRQSSDSLEVAVLVDNLEKLNPLDRRLVERLYLERMVALKELDAHLVITVPLYLCYSAAGATLIGLYGGEVVVLPMIKVRKPMAAGGGDEDVGIESLAALLGRRIDFEKLFVDKMEAARRIARESGGCIRHALRMVTGAVNECDVAPVGRVEVERAIAGVAADFERALPEKWIAHLRAVAETNRFPSALDDGEKREMLRHLFVLEYQNGDPAPWYAVHPLVERCAKFRQT